MAELEVVDHLKKGIKALSPKTGHSIGHRLREFLLEIFIIVFAITLSIWLHERSEHRHVQKEVTYFLRELYKDLAYDQRIYEQARADTRLTTRAYAYVAGLPEAGAAGIDSIGQYESYLFRLYTPVPTQGRYQSYKYSGRINNIENAELQGDILDLFEEDLAILNTRTEAYRRLQDAYKTFIISHTTRKAPHAGYAMDESANYAQLLQHTEEMGTAYDTCIAKIKAVNAQILKEVGDIM